jgi:hypothetical protein
MLTYSEKYLKTANSGFAQYPLWLAERLPG